VWTLLAVLQGPHTARIESAQDNTVAIVAIAVSGGVALLSALVTPITAHYRQKAANAAERGLNDLAELRTILDAGAEELQRLTNELMVLGTLLRRGTPTSLDALKSKSQVSRSKIWPMYRAAERLQIRLGPDAHVTTALREGATALDAALNAIIAWERLPPKSAREETRARLVEIVTSVRSLYVNAATQMVASELPDSPGHWSPPSFERRPDGP
jgi:hypothetical protein